MSKKKIDQNKICELYTSGNSCELISKLLNNSPKTIRKYLTLNNIIIRKRRLVKCFICNKETKNNKFCSIKCRDLVEKVKKSYYCNKCQCLLQEGWTNRKYCKSCNKYLFKFWNEITLKELLSKYPLYQVHAKIREKARKNLKSLNINSCQNCGYDKFVECCHIKPIKNFDKSSLITEVNHISNLVGLCPNCHYELDNGYITIEQIKSSGG